MKIVTIAAALDKGCITTDTRIEVPDFLQNGSYPLRDDERHPKESWTPKDIITHSSNVGTAIIAQRCFDNAAEFDAVLKKYGFGRPTGLGFPGETNGRLVNLRALVRHNETPTFEIKILAAKGHYRDFEILFKPPIQPPQARLRRAPSPGPWPR